MAFYPSIPQTDQQLAFTPNGLGGFFYDGKGSWQGATISQTRAFRAIVDGKTLPHNREMKKDADADDLRLWLWYSLSLILFLIYNCIGII